MPLIEVLDDDGNDQEQSHITLEELLSTIGHSLRVPKGFKYSAWAARSDAAKLLAWKDASFISMKRLHSAIQAEDWASLDNLFVPLIELVVPFTGSGDWINRDAQKYAQEILTALGNPSQSQIRSILLQIVKPAFEKASQNEQLNTSSGTRTNRPLILEPIYHDALEDVWKDIPGLIDIITWSLISLQESDWETLWPLLIPPVLTYMDDWEAQYRIQGIKICQLLVERAPASLLTRTGIDELMRSSLNTSLFRYSDDLSPILFKSAMITSLKLVSKTTKPDSSERYSRLFALLGETVIGGAWMLGYREPQLIQATYEILPSLLDELGVACVRYLKAMVPQLLHTLVPEGEISLSRSMQEASLQTLRKVVQVGKLRMECWSGEILSGLLKFWILSENQRDDEMQNLVVKVLKDLEKACPKIFEEHIQTIKDLDEAQSTPLFHLFET